MSGNVASVAVAVGAGLLMVAITLLFPSHKRKSKVVVSLIGVGTFLIVCVLWPGAVLVEVPDLSNLSRDEAELRLSSLELVGAPQPQNTSDTRPEHVILSSQDPLPGTRVRRGTLVRYSISTPTPVVHGRTDVTDASTSTPAIAIFSPRESGDVVPRRGADNVFRFDVEGTIECVVFDTSSLLLWIQPIEPPSDQPGWYLQRLPVNGILSITGNKWRGVCQLGNQQYPPHDGDVIEIAATVTPAEEATLLEARPGPTTTVMLPGVVSRVVRLTVRLK